MWEVSPKSLPCHPGIPQPDPAAPGRLSPVPAGNLCPILGNPGAPKVLGTPCSAPTAIPPDSRRPSESPERSPRRGCLGRALPGGIQGHLGHEHLRVEVGPVDVGGVRGRLGRLGSGRAIVALERPVGSPPPPAPGAPGGGLRAAPGPAAGPAPRCHRRHRVPASARPPLPASPRAISDATLGLPWQRGSGAGHGGARLPGLGGGGRDGDGAAAGPVPLHPGDKDCRGDGDMGGHTGPRGVRGRWHRQPWARVPHRPFPPLSTCPQPSPVSPCVPSAPVHPAPAPGWLRVMLEWGGEAAATTLHLARGTNIWAKRSKISFIYSRKGEINPARLRARLLQESQAIDSSQEKEPRAATVHQEEPEEIPAASFLLPFPAQFYFGFPNVEKKTLNPARVWFLCSLVRGTTFPS